MEQELSTVTVDVVGLGMGLHREPAIRSTRLAGFDLEGEPAIRYSPVVDFMVRVNLVEDRMNPHREPVNEMTKDWEVSSKDGLLTSSSERGRTMVRLDSIVAMQRDRDKDGAEQLKVWLVGHAEARRWYEPEASKEKLSAIEQQWRLYMEDRAKGKTFEPLMGKPLER